MTPFEDFKIGEVDPDESYEVIYCKGSSREIKLTMPGNVIIGQLYMAQGDLTSAMEALGELSLTDFQQIIRQGEQQARS